MQPDQPATPPVERPVDLNFGLRPTAGSGSSRRAQEPDADLVARVAQAMRDANTPAAWAQAQTRPAPNTLWVPIEVYARAAVDEMTRCAQERDPLSPPPARAFLGEPVCDKPGCPCRSQA